MPSSSLLSFVVPLEMLAHLSCWQLLVVPWLGGDPLAKLQLTKLRQLILCKSIENETVTLQVLATTKGPLWPIMVECLCKVGHAIVQGPTCILLLSKTN
jgi:hypothetical protein